MFKHLVILIVLGLSYLELTKGHLSCYQCNVELRNRFTQDCTDPYAPSPLDHLLPCPEDEPHQCMKAVVLYNNNDVTVRACVPSRLRNSYCEDRSFINFPNAQVTCEFCEDDACNHSTSRAEPYGSLVLGLVISLVIVNF